MYEALKLREYLLEWTGYELQRPFPPFCILAIFIFSDLFVWEPLPFFPFRPLGSEDLSSSFLLSCSTVFAQRNDQRPLEILGPDLSTLSVIIHQQQSLKNEHTHQVCVTDLL